MVLRLRQGGKGKKKKKEKKQAGSPLIEASTFLSPIRSTAPWVPIHEEGKGEGGKKKKKRKKRWRLRWNPCFLRKIGYYHVALFSAGKGGGEERGERGGKAAGEL